MSALQQFKTDSKAEKEGIVVEYDDPEHPEDKSKTVWFRIARAGGANSKYSKVMERLAKPLRRQIANEQLSLPQAQKLGRQAFAEACLLDWGTGERHEIEVDGQWYAPTIENGVKVFEMLPDLFADLDEQAKKLLNFREASREADGKN